MIDQIMLWKDGIHLTDDGTKMLAGNFLKCLGTFLGNVIDFNEDFNNSVNGFLD